MMNGEASVVALLEQVRVAAGGRAVELGIRARIPTREITVTFREDGQAERVLLLPSMAAGQRRTLRLDLETRVDGNFALGVMVDASRGAPSVYAGRPVVPTHGSTWYLVWRAGRVVQVMNQLPVRRPDGSIDPEMMPGAQSHGTISVQICDDADPSCSPPPPPPNPGTVVYGTITYRPPGLKPEPLYKATVRLMGSDMRR
ncbi:MAG: hypothetical protein IT359_03670 [Gemmatimonadaceae bacterium]|nr:hypothetical protein [Gemmatimonadaceae bacterium]